MSTLRDKVVVITGAGSGIGRALAFQAASEGAILALSDWNELPVKETLRLATGKRVGEGIARRVDVRSQGEVNAFASEVQAAFGGAHVVVNNAGVSLSDTVGSMKREDFEWLIDINFWGVVRGTEAFLPQLRARDDAHLVNISSIFGIVGIPGQSAYNASKFAVRGFSESLRQELHGSSVKVTCVHPGGVRTNIIRNGKMNTTSQGAVAIPEKVATEFDKLARTSPEEAARIIWKGTMAGAPRVLVGADAKVLDVLQRLLPAGYPTVLRVAQRMFEKRTGVVL